MKRCCEPENKAPLEPFSNFAKLAPVNGDKIRDMQIIT